MAYINGSAASFADLKTAIENACKANGWSLQNGILSKNGCFYKLETHERYINLFGGTGQQGSELTGVLKISNENKGCAIISNEYNLINFPINYEIFIFDNPQEVYCVVNFNSDFYAHLSFGKSQIEGIGGTGSWLTGSQNSSDSKYFNLNFQYYVKCFISRGDDYCIMSQDVGFTVGFFTSDSDSGSSANYVHCDLDGLSWKSNNDNKNALKAGSRIVAGLLASLPNVMTGSTVLLPIRAFLKRSENRITTLVNLNNARYTRNDNLQPGEIVIFGNEKWKVYPWYRKNVIERDGVSWSTGAMHSGTFAYAIRYEG